MEVDDNTGSGDGTLLTEGTVAPPSQLQTSTGNPEVAEGGPDGADRAISAAVHSPPEWAPEKFWDPNTKSVRQEDLGRAYINLEKLVGRDKVPLPLSEDDKEGWERFYKASGRPDDVKGYEFNRPELPKDLEYDEEMENEFREWAHINGLNKRQATAFYDGYVKRQVDRHTAWTQSRQQQRQEAQIALQREYGKNYDAAVNSARAAMMEYADPDFHQFLNETGYGNDPRMIRIFARIGKDLGGDQRIQGRQAMDVNPGDIDKAIAEFRGKYQDALFAKDHPDHSMRVAEYNKLFEKRYGA